MSLRRVVTITINPAVDVTTAVDVVQSERKLRCDAPTLEPGGGGINVSRALTRLGVASTAFYLAGGPLGDLLERLLADEGVDGRRTPIAGLTRQSLVVQERASGGQYRFGMPGPRIDEDECQRLLAAVDREAAEIVVASGSLADGVPADLYGQLARSVRERGGCFVLDTSGTALAAGLAGRPYLVKPSEREFRELTGVRAHDDAALDAPALALVAAGRADAVLVSVGPRGARLAHDGGVTVLPPHDVPVASAVGAGDSMVAGVVAGLARGWGLGEAARLGVAAGAAAVMTAGTELCRRADVERLFGAPLDEHTGTAVPVGPG